MVGIGDSRDFIGISSVFRLVINLNQPRLVLTSLCVTP